MMQLEVRPNAAEIDVVFVLWDRGNIHPATLSTLSHYPRCLIIYLEL